MKKIIYVFLSMALVYVTYAGTTVSSQPTTNTLPISSAGEAFTTSAPQKYKLNVGTVYAATNPDALKVAAQGLVTTAATTEHSQYHQTCMYGN